MPRWKWLVPLAGVAAMALMGLACARGSAGAPSITVAGSTAFQPFAEVLAEHYMEAHPDVSVNVQGGGSMVGIQAVNDGVADIGMADLVELPPEASRLKATVVARDGIAIIVHPTNPVSGLTLEQLRGIFAGRIANWKDVGGPDLAMRVISREEGSGTRRSFEDLLMKGQPVSARLLVQDSSGTVRESVASDPGAIGYLSIGLVNGSVRAVPIEGVAPTNANAEAGQYPLVRPIWLLTRPGVSAAAADLLAYMLSPAAQETIARDGLLPAQGRQGGG